MKQLFRTTLCAILSMLALSACNDELPTMTDVLHPSPSNDPAACVLMGDDFCWDEAETRTSLTVENNVALFSWTTGDLVGILPDAGAQVYFAIPEPATPAGVEGDEEQATEQRLNASFDGGAWALKPESSYAAYYPFIKDFDLDRTAVPVDYTGQAQTGNSSTAHLGAFDFMGARPATTNGSGGVAFDFDHVGALVELRFTVPNEGTALKSVTLTADGAAFTVKGAYDLTTEEGFPITAATEGGTANEMIIGLDYTTTEANEEVIVYFMCAPIDLTDKLINVSVAYGESDDLLYFETQGKKLQAGRGSRLLTEISYPYLTFTATEEQTFTIKVKSPLANRFTFPDSFEYSVGTDEWAKLTADTQISFGGVNGSLRLRGKSGIGTAQSSTRYSLISFGKNSEVACTGDIRTLVNWENYGSANTSGSRFCNLFKGCTSLTAAPKLPATTLADYCYYHMFEGCTSLTTAPKLPAENLVDYCYTEMFYGCTSLTTAPKLPAENLVDHCYNSMFEGCTSLTTAPELLAENLAISCYDSMFKGCTSLVTAPELPATTLAHSCYYHMFEGCTSLVTAPELPATTLVNKCYYQMFYGCTSLETAPPILPAETLIESCYSNMFSDCTSLAIAPVLPATALADCCYDRMFSGCTSLTTAPELPAETLTESCYSYMFKGCTSLTTAPELPATTLAKSCYERMFYGCTSLNSITMLATDISANNCLLYWVTNVAASGTFTKAAAMTSLLDGENGIPSGWTVKNN